MAIGGDPGGSLVPLSEPRLITIVLFGTHCAGKSTVSKQLAEILNWKFEPELVDTMRGQDVTANGHKVGDGSGHASSTWDCCIHDAELERDQKNAPFHRVVESWHVGNFGWACVRLNELSEDSIDDKAEIEKKHRDAISLALKKVSSF